MLDALSAPWPWYVAGPLIGLVVPMLLLFGGKVFGISANLRHACAALPVPASAKPSFLRYDWRKAGAWNLVFVLGIAVGGALSVLALGVPDAGQSISAATQADLRGLGLTDFSGLVPVDLFSWSALATPVGLLVLLGGGFLVRFRHALRGRLHERPCHLGPRRPPGAVAGGRRRLLHRRAARDVGPVPAAVRLKTPSEPFPDPSLWLPTLLPSSLPISSAWIPSR